MRIKMPAVRIAQGELDTGQPHQDILTCGVCQKPFVLGDINKFIQHKVHVCNKENYAVEQNNVQDLADDDDDDDDDEEDTSGGAAPLTVVNTRRPSISAPIKKGVVNATPVAASGRLVCSSPLHLDEEARCSTPKPVRTTNSRNSSSGTSTPIKDEMDIDNHNHHHHHHPHLTHHPANCNTATSGVEYDDMKPRKIKQELDSTNSSPDFLKKTRTVPDAESNTANSEPNYYLCYTCKEKIHSAWRLVQHAQHMHGIKIYVEPLSLSPSLSSSSPPTNLAAPASQNVNDSSSSACSALSGCSQGLSSSTSAPLISSSLSAPSTVPLPPAAAVSMSSRLPALPSTSNTAVTEAHNRFGIGGLLGVPLNEPAPSRHHPFPLPLSLVSDNNRTNGNNNSGISNGPPFSRSSFHDNQFRMEQIVSEQFRLNQHHSLNLAAAVAAANSLQSAHSPYPPPGMERPPSSNSHTSSVHRSMIPPPPSLSLPLEPQVDFYSQKLRQLAGTTSPSILNGSNSLSPRKLTSPFTSPGGNSQPLPPSKSSLSPRIPVSSSGGSSNKNTGNNHNNENSSHTNHLLNHHYYNHHHYNNNHNNNNSASVSNNNLSEEQSSDADQSLSPILKSTGHEENNSLDMSTSNARDRCILNDEKATDFSNNQNLANSEAESEEKNKECNFCGKKFRFQSNLVVHRRTHTGEKPYKCSVCDHACTQSSKLKRHMKIHRKFNRIRKNDNLEIATNDTAARTNNDKTVDSDSNLGRDQLSNDDGSDNEHAMQNEEHDAEDEDDDDDEEEDVEEEEEEDDDEDEDAEEEEGNMELDEEGDEDDDGNVPEDLTTKSVLSTPPNGAGDDSSKSMHSPRPTPTQTPISTDNNIPSMCAPGGVGGGSLVSELMDTFGLSNIQQYSEAYKQALQESGGGSSHKAHIRKKDDLAILEASGIAMNNNNGITKGIPHMPENGMKLKPPSLASAAAALKLKEEFAKSISMTGQPPFDLINASRSIFSGSPMPFENIMDVASKRLKLDLDARHPLVGGAGGRNSIVPPDDGMYPNIWFPATIGSAHLRDLFARNEMAPSSHDLFTKMQHRSSKSNSENRHSSGKPLNLAAAAAAVASMNLPGQQHLKKESRRNDTCEYCGKVFKNCSNLTVHRRSHTGEKPYKCELCSYACAQSSKLTRHMKTHGRSGKDVYKCRFCEMPFSVPSTLEKHMRKCVVNQNIKGGDNSHLMPTSMFIKCDDDSSLSSAKDNT